MLDDENALYSGVNSGIRTKLKWTDNRLDFAELIYALHEIGCINGGNTFLTDLFYILCNSFDFKI